MKQLLIILDTYMYWKDNPYQSFEYIPWIILFAVVFIGAVYLISRIYKSQTDLWHKFQHSGLKHHLDPQELMLLRRFYDHLGIQERKTLIDSKEKFYKKMFIFLSGIHDVKLHESVEIMARLFLHPASQNRIEHLRDLYKGEVIFIETDNRRFLGAVMEHTPEESENEIAVYIVKISDFASLIGNKAKVYAYRINQGSFFIDVQIEQASETALRLTDDRNIVFKSEEKLAAKIEFLIRMYPVPTLHERNLIETEKNDPQVSQHHRKTDDFLDGQSIQISGKAILLELDDHSRIHYDRKREMWELVFEYPGGSEIITLKGSMFPLPGSASRFLFKFTDADTETKEKIGQLISESNPFRENSEI
jgi:hypothetical protein